MLLAFIRSLLFVLLCLCVIFGMLMPLPRPYATPRGILALVGFLLTLLAVIATIAGGPSGRLL